MQVSINNNVRLLPKQRKVLSSSTSRRMQIWTKNIKMENLIDDDLEKSSSHGSGGEFDNDESN